MSFDQPVLLSIKTQVSVSIPFEQGDVFRRTSSCRCNYCCYVSIPFEQGDVFRLLASRESTKKIFVSIPFEQGDVFRPQGNSEICWAFRSQSLSSRAMSFDSRTAQYEMELTKSQSLSSRAMSFDKYKKLKHYSYMSQSLSSRAMSFDKVLRNNSINLSYVSIPFEQGDVFRPAIVSSML